MNSQPAPAPTMVSSERQNEADTQLHGRTLVFARVGWVSFAILILAISTILFPIYFAQLQTVCTGAMCAASQPTSNTAHVLKTLGLSVEGYAVFTFVLILVSTLGCFALSAVIFWRKSDDWMALLIGLVLVPYSTGYVTYALQQGQSAWSLLALVLNILTYGAFILAGSLFPDGRFIPVGRAASLSGGSPGAWSFSSSVTSLGPGCSII